MLMAYGRVVVRAALALKLALAVNVDVLAMALREICARELSPSPYIAFDAPFFGGFVNGGSCTSPPSGFTILTAEDACGFAKYSMAGRRRKRAPDGRSNGGPGQGHCSQHWKYIMRDIVTPNINQAPRHLTKMFDPNATD